MVSPTSRDSISRFRCPRGIETPLVPLAARGGNRAGGEYSYSLNERPKLPPGAEVRPAVVDPADGKIPLRPEALAKRKDIISKQEQIEHLDGRVLCLAPGIPRTTIPAPVVGYQIMQKPGAVVIFYEQSHLYRVIPLDNRPPLDPAIKKAMGVSRGRWEGNVLVVEVTNFTNNFENDWVIGAASAATGVPAESLASGHGIPHSEMYRVTERYTPIDANTIHYEATITDEKGLHAAVDDRLLRVCAGAEGLRAGRICLFRGEREEHDADDEHRRQPHPRERALALSLSIGREIPCEPRALFLPPALR